MTDVHRVFKHENYVYEHRTAFETILYIGMIVRRSADRTLKKFNLSINEYKILRRLIAIYTGSIGADALKDFLIESSDNVSRVLEKLQSKGLVLRIASRANKRKTQVAITSTGLDLINLIDSHINAHLMCLSDQETKLLTKYLEKILIPFLQKAFKKSIDNSKDIFNLENQQFFNQQNQSS